VLSLLSLHSTEQRNVMKRREMEKTVNHQVKSSPLRRPHTDPSMLYVDLTDRKRRNGADRAYWCQVMKYKLATGVEGSIHVT
jgi:hypothetical protein